MWWGWCTATWLLGWRSVGGSTSIHRHHAHPNQEGLDPDIGGENLVYACAQAGGRRGLAA
jgi:hypothetical protein